MMRFSRAGDGTLQIGARVGRGAWVCGAAHEVGLRDAIRRSLRGSVSNEEIDAVEQALRAWTETMRERSGA